MGLRPVVDVFCGRDLLLLLPMTLPGTSQGVPILLSYGFHDLRLAFVPRDHPEGTLHAPGYYK